MAKFEMLSGSHVDTRTGKAVMATKGTKTSRQIINSDVNLDFTHGKRFRRLDGMRSTGPRDEESPPKKADAVDVEGVEETEMLAGDVTGRPVRKVKNPRNDMEADSNLGSGPKKMKSGKQNRVEAPETEPEEDEEEEEVEGEESEDEEDTMEEDQSGQDDPEEVLVGPRDSEDVTSKFKEASGALVKVFKDKKGKYVVTDEDDVSKPLPKASKLKDAAAVHKWIKSYNKK